MDKWGQVNKKDIKEKEFISMNIVEEERPKENYRVSSKDMEKYDSNFIQLKKEISTIFEKHSKQMDRRYDCTEIKCLIPEDTMRKTLSGRCKITRLFLAKYTVGLKIDLETADKLFKLHSGELNPDYKFDYIIMCALKDGDSIEDFIEDVQRYCNINLLRERA